MGFSTASGLNRAYGPALRFSLSLLACLPALTAAASLEKVIEDQPGHLVLEVAIPDFRLTQAGAAGGEKVACAGLAGSLCRPLGVEGAPDLPAYRFSVLSGPAAPRVTLSILESETRIVSDGIAPYPRYTGSSQADYRRDETAYGRAATAEARVLGLHGIRGAPVRTIQVPMALWNQGPHTLTLIKRLQVRIDFPGVLSRPAPPLAEALRREIKNPVGGAWLYAPAANLRPPRVVGPGGRALGKTAALSGGLSGLASRANLGKAALPVATDLGDTLVRIKIRNKSVESFAEDRYYAIPFGSLPDAAARVMAGQKLNRMRLLTGINDTLPLAMDSAGALPGRLHEIPMEVVDADGSGTFTQGDSLKFFAHGTNLWKRNEDFRTAIRYDFSNDPYSFENFYYLDFGSAASEPLRLKPIPTPPPAGTPLEHSPYYLRAEKDVETAVCDPTKAKDREVGPDWHWKWKGKGCPTESFADLTAGDLASEETAALPNRVGDTVLIGMYTYPSGGSFEITFKGKTLEGLPDSVIPGVWYDSLRAGAWYLSTASFPSSEAFIPEKAHWSGPPRFEGYTLIYERAHALGSGGMTWIFPTETGKTVSYRVQGGGGAYCARIEDGEPSAFLTLDGEGIFTDSLPAGSNSRYLIFKSPSALASNAIDLEVLPKGGSKGPLRDLATCDGTPTDKLPEYLILTARPLLGKAMALRDYRDSATRAVRARPTVVLVEDIYRQFSGGRLSPTAIRDFLRYAYLGWDRGSSGAGILKYVLLFGDGNYDYRNINGSARGAATNFVPPFEYMPVTPGSPEGQNQLATDDFYAMFEPGLYNLESSPLSLAIGRLPVQSAQEADGYLAKIHEYEDPRKSGEWRAHVVLAADDNLQRNSDNNNLDLIVEGHTTDTDNLGRTITDNESGTSLDKVYLLDYPLNSAYHKPQAAQDLLTLINRGAVAVNYVGHGASNQWADEVLLQTNDAVARMRNEGRTGMVNAFSCTVGRFESLTSEGMSEQFVKTPKIGAVGAVSATRESYPGPNLVLANDFYDRAFPPDTSGQIATVGEALQFAKNATFSAGGGLNNLKYGLLGEPVMLMRKPPLRIGLTDVMDTIRALDCGNLRGRVTGGSGNGKINLKVLAGSNQKIYGNLGPNMHDQVVEKRGNILFDGTVPYQNGEFSAQYFIPKQISYGDTNAQILAFAWDDSLEREGTTAIGGLRIRGTSTKSCATDADGKGPRIRITGCEKKETGNVDFPEKVKLSLPYCLQVDVTDSSGGVMSAVGPDEGTTFEIPGVVDPYHPQAGIDDLFHKTYQLTLDPQNIRPGSHLLKVSARDGYGNYSARQMQMDISLDSSIVFIKAYNHPNPMKRNGTTFHFATGMPAAELEYGDNAQSGQARLEFEVRIFNQAGRLVQVLKQARSGETHWDGRDRWGNQLANGLYFYKVTATQVRFELEDRPGYSTVSSKYNTLVLSR
jgi:hypothetical protein